MDAFLVKRIVSELSREIRGALVSKVHQPGEREIVLTLWTGRDEKRLLLSADPELCRIHLTTRKVPSPPSPPRFCQFLRRHLEGMRVAECSVEPFDRSVRIDFASLRPDALHEATTLYAELFGRHANLIYVDAGGTILSPLRAVTPEESRIREVLPGVPYRPLPPPDRIVLPAFSAADAERILAGAWEGLGKALQREISGLGRELADEAAAGGKAGARGLHDAVRALARRYEEDDFEPGIGTHVSGRKRLLPFPCPDAGFAGFEPAGSANEAADRYYGEVAESRELAVLRQQLSSRIRALLRKERNTLENVGGDEERLKEGLKGKEYGERLKTNLGAVRRGMKEFEGVPLDPARTPVENMERFFRQYKKARGAVEIVRNRRREVTEAVYYVESLETQLSAARTREELVAVRQELSASFAPKGKGRGGHGGKARRKGAPQALPVPQVEQRTFGGFTILVGKNNVGNDRIVRELAAPDDLWLHAQGIPGSHVLVRRPAGKEVPREVIEEAARLAVEHSKAKGSSNVPVFLAEARHVSRFKGAKPGLVRIARHTTVRVR